MSLLARLVARLGIDCGLPAAGVQRAWLAADALASKEAEEDVAEPMDDLAVQRFLREEAELDRLRDTLRNGGIAAWERELLDFPAGVESTPAPPAGSHFAGAAASLADGDSPSGVFCKPSVREDKQCDRTPLAEPGNPHGMAAEGSSHTTDPQPTPRCARCDCKLGEMAASSDLAPGMFCSNRCVKAAEILLVLREHPNSPVGVSTPPPEASVPPTGLPMFKASELVLVAIEYIGLHEGWRRPDRTWECACTQKFASKFDLDAHVAELVVSAITAELTALAYDEPVCPHCGGRPWVVHCPNGVTQAMCQHHGFISTERK